MTALKVHHRTTYRYHQPVMLGSHRLMLRPRESRDLHLLSNSVTITPDATVTWAYDVFGNAVAVASFQAMTDTLVIDSAAEIQLYAPIWPVFQVASHAASYPFNYSDEEWSDLGALTARQYPDPARRLAQWARGFVRSSPTDTLALLKDLSAGVSLWIRYQSREEEGTQSPKPDPRSRVGFRAGTSLSCSSKRRAASASARGSRRVTSTIQPGSRVSTAARLMPGRKSMCQGPVGSPSIRPTAVSARPI